MRTVIVPEVDLQRLLRGGVVLIGDSAHATPILGGRGANAAIADAVKLAEVIGKTGSNEESLSVFVHQAWPEWRSEVEQSTINIAETHAPAKASL